MKMSHSPLLARVLVAGALSAASLTLAAPASAYDNRQIPQSERGPAGSPSANHCAKLEVVYARGTSETPGTSWALNGLSSNPSVRDEFMPTAIYNQITNDLGNTYAPHLDANGALQYYEREYVTKYSELDTPGLVTAANDGRSDFALWHAEFQANPGFILSTNETNSVQQGTINVINHLLSENARCPNKKYMLFGYSQGALIIANVISLPTMRKYWYGTSTAPLLMAPLHSKIVSVGLLADAGFNSTESVTIAATATTTERQEYDRAQFATSTIVAPGSIFNGTKQDLNGRRNLSNVPLGVMRGKLEEPGVGPAYGLRAPGTYYSTFANSTGTVNKVRSYCLSEDPICNRSSTNAAAHIAYFDNPVPRTNLAVFAVQKLRQTDPRWATPANPAPSGNAFPQFAQPNSALVVPGQ